MELNVRRSLPAGTVLTLALGLTVIAGCTEPTEWLVYGSSNSSRPVLIRIEFDGGVRQARLDPSREGQVVAGDGRGGSGRILVLDARTCEVLAVESLPIGQVLVRFRDGFAGALEVSVRQRNVGRSPNSLPEDVSCDAGSARLVDYGGNNRIRFHYAGGTTTAVPARAVSRVLGRAVPTPCDAAFSVAGL